MTRQDSDFLCGGWTWNSSLNELRFYERKGGNLKEKPEQIERLDDIRTLTWHKWSQAPMQSPSGQTISGSLSRVIIQYKNGASLTINENDRECASKLVSTLASAFGLRIIRAGAPGDRRLSTTPQSDKGRQITTQSGRTKTVVDLTTGDIVETKRYLGVTTSQKAVKFNDVQQLELSYKVKGPVETYQITAVHGSMGQRITVASYQGLEGWARCEEWQQLAKRMARDMGGVKVVKEEI